MTFCTTVHSFSEALEQHKALQVNLSKLLGLDFYYPAYTKHS